MNNIIKDKFYGSLAVGSVDDDCGVTTVSVCTYGMTLFLEAGQVEELIGVLQDRLKEMKG